MTWKGQGLWSNSRKPNAMLGVRHAEKAVTQWDYRASKAIWLVPKLAVLVSALSMLQRNVESSEILH